MLMVANSYAFLSDHSKHDNRGRVKTKRNVNLILIFLKVIFRQIDKHKFINVGDNSANVGDAGTMQMGHFTYFRIFLEASIICKCNAMRSSNRKLQWLPRHKQFCTLDKNYHGVDMWNTKLESMSLVHIWDMTNFIKLFNDHICIEIYF